jgi:hypothetical protein
MLSPVAVAWQLRLPLCSAVAPLSPSPCIMPCDGCGRWIQDPVPGRSIIVVQDLFEKFCMGIPGGVLCGIAVTVRNPCAAPDLPRHGVLVTRLRAAANQRRHMKGTAIPQRPRQGFPYSTYSPKEATEYTPAIVMRWCRSCRAFMEMRMQYARAVQEIPPHLTSWLCVGSQPGYSQSQSQF